MSGHFLDVIINFYLCPVSRVLKDWKEKDRTHVDWVKAWLCTLTELQAYVKKYYTPGLTWKPAGGEAKALVRAGGASPPPPPVPAPRRDARLAEQGRGRHRGAAQDDSRTEDTGPRAGNVRPDEKSPARKEYFKNKQDIAIKSMSWR